MLSPSLLFWFLSGILISSIAFTITTHVVIYRVLSLIMSFIITAALAIIIGIEFIAFSLILIYVGAVMVLFLFVIMMIDSKHSISSNKIPAPKWYIPTAIIGIMLVTICGIAATDSLMFNYSTSNEKLQVSGASLKIIGQYLYTEYQDVVVIMGILLLIATIGIVTMVIDFTKKPRLQVKVSEQLARDPKDSLTIVSVPFGSGVDY